MDWGDSVQHFYCSSHSWKLFPNFFLIIFATIIIGTSQILGELTIIGFIKCFPPIIFSGYSSGTGISGFIGASLYLGFKMYNVSFTNTLLCLLILYPIFGTAFMFIIRLKLNTGPATQAERNQAHPNPQSSSNLFDNHKEINQNKSFFLSNAKKKEYSQALLEENES